jgi:hypothetical protein
MSPAERSLIIALVEDTTSRQVFRIKKSYLSDSTDDEVSLSDVFTICPLDECYFSAGTIHRYDKRIESLDRRPDDFLIVTVHANYILGSEKQHMMKTRGLWLATKGTKATNDSFTAAHNSNNKPGLLELSSKLEKLAND